MSCQYRRDCVLLQVLSYLYVVIFQVLNIGDVHKLSVQFSVTTRALVHVSLNLSVEVNAYLFNHTYFGIQNVV
jgi:hypothetical protein